MTYLVQGLDPAPFRPLFAMDDEELRRRHARRVEADSQTGFPCRVSLANAAVGEALILLHHVSQSSATPYRSAFAIYVSEGAREAARHFGHLPPAIDRRTLTLRAHDSDGMMRAALLVQPGEGDLALRRLFDDEAVESIHIHTAAPGCFLAAAVRGPE